MRISAFKGFAASLVLCAASPRFAQGRPDTTTMSCKAAAALVTARGAIVLSTGPTTYDRYVRDGGFCTADEFAKPAFVASADNRQCFIGYYCFEKEYENDR
jgi:hypothetical protein